MDYENWEREDAIDSRWGGENEQELDLSIVVQTCVLSYG
jgi:hypothetical protein